MRYSIKINPLKHAIYHLKTHQNNHLRATAGPVAVVEFSAETKKGFG